MRKTPLLTAIAVVLCCAADLAHAASAVSRSKDETSREDFGQMLGPDQSERSFQALGDFRISQARVSSDPSRPWMRVIRGGRSLSIDLSNLWAGDLPRNQGEWGTCTAFAVVAIYEAAVARTGGCTRLSEADLFLQANVLRWGCWDGRQSCATALEGMSIDRMSDHVKTKGVLVGDDYRDYMELYDEARWESDLRTNYGRSQIRSGQTRKGDWFSGFLSNPFGYAPLFNHERDEVRDKLASYAAYNGSGRPDAARRGVAAKFSGYTRHGKAFNVRPGPWNTDEHSCRAEGNEQENFIDGELLEGRPVAVTMSLKGLSAWNAANAADGAWHSFVIKGVYDSGPSGTKLYSTRNSWGGDNPAVDASELCRVQYAESILLPGERPAPAEGMAGLWRSR